MTHNSSSPHGPEDKVDPALHVGNMNGMGGSASINSIDGAEVPSWDVPTTFVDPPGGSGMLGDVMDTYTGLPGASMQGPGRETLVGTEFGISNWAAWETLPGGSINPRYP